jgi:dGTPase
MAVTGAMPRAPWAADPARSRGRLHAEDPSPGRSDFRRDCDRVIHSTAFRRLMHKTQVFVSQEADHFRTRLTHTLEVTQIARALARELALDEDLTEALALAHDLGHPPFGHAGERALDRSLGSYGGFDHNAQSLKIVTRLERRYAPFDGLNLTWETLEGMTKHNGPLFDSADKPLERYQARGVPEFFLEYGREQDLELHSWPTAEAQAAAIADDIAYDAHDLDDGLRAAMFAIEDLGELPLVSEILDGVRARFGELERPRLANELTRRLIARMIRDVVQESERRLAALRPASLDDIRHAGRAVVGFSAPLAVTDRAIKDFLMPRLYRHPRVTSTMDAADAVVSDLFAHYLEHPDDLPPDWRERISAGDRRDRARVAADFIAGMTDRFALDQHRRFFDTTPELR